MCCSETCNEKYKKSKILVLPAPELAKICPPGKFGAVTAPETIVYEVDLQVHGNSENPHGVGPFLGAVTHPFGPDWGVWWFDGQQEALPKKNLGKAPQPGTKIEYKNKMYEVEKFDKFGCHASFDYDATQMLIKKKHIL